MSARQLDQIPLSVLDLATVVRDSTPREAFERTVALAQLADRAGFERFWLAEHHNLEGIASAATAVLIGHVAAHTSRIRVGSGGVMLPNHSPLIVAEQFGTLESLYPGRIDLGLGRAPGTDPVTVRAVRGPYAAMEPEFGELVAELQDYFRPAAAGQRVRAVPGEGLDVPIWLLGSSGYSARLAGELGLPFAFASHFAPHHLLDALALYRSVFRPSDALRQPHAMVAMNVVAADSDERAEYLSTSLKQRFLRMVQGRRGRLDPPVEDMDALWSAEEKAVVEAHLRASAFGAPGTVLGRMQAFLDETGADEIIVGTDTYALEDRLRSYELLARSLGRL